MLLGYKMKIRLLSDLHMEGHSYYYDYAGEDLVVLAGDIHTQNRHKNLLDQIPSNVKVIMIAGNHEYYGSEFNSMNLFFAGLENRYPNFYYLQNESVCIDGVDFFGGTMFTDFNLYGYPVQAPREVVYGIADFSWIKKSDKRWTPQDHVTEHTKFCEYLEAWLQQEHTKRVVISHFVPHPVAADPQFEGSALNPYFIANMEQYMGWQGLWLFGHTHHAVDTYVGATRLVCNPKGYGSENQLGFVKNLIVEI
jgi:predicted phosphodiesterase